MKDDEVSVNTLLLLAVLAVTVYGGLNGWFNFTVNMNFPWLPEDGGGGFSYGSPTPPYYYVTPTATPTVTHTPTPSPTATPTATPTPSPTLAPLSCGETAYPMCNGACASGFHCLHKEAATCACYPSGDSNLVNFGYASCQAASVALGKEFFVTGVNPPITSLGACEAYAQSYCQQFGSPPWYVTMFDWSPTECCVWNCNGSWK
jgi:hypothetical protein